MSPYLSNRLDSIVIERIKAIWKHYQLSVGVHAINAQHVWLVALVLELEWHLHNSAEGEVPPVFSEILQEAVLYTREHFSAEELMMHEFHYAGFGEHLKTHLKFVETIQKIAGEKTELKREQAEKLFNVLKNWLINHIVKEDKSYSDFFQRRKIFPEVNAFMEAEIKKGTIKFREDQIALLDHIIEKGNTIECTTPKILEQIKEMWTKYNMKIGIPLIDIQHLWLVKMIVDMNEAMDESEVTRLAVLTKTIEDAIEYVDVHFHTEELFMEKIGFPELPGHKKQHEKLVEQVKARKEEFDKGNQHKAMNLVIDLKEWLTAHILISDKKYVETYNQNKDIGQQYSRELIDSGEARLHQNQINLYKHLVQGK